MKKTSLLLCALLFGVAAASPAAAQSARKRVSILGDSYSTFEGYVVPADNLVYYPSLDVREVGLTWWHLLLSMCDLELERNCSYSGSTVCHTGYDGADYSDRSFIARMGDLGDPDIILVFGGTNDSWAGVPLGCDLFDGWSSEELYSFRPAFCRLLDSLPRLYPGTAIFCISNTDLSPAIEGAISEICARYDVPNIRLHDIDKQYGHPTAAGMRSIAAQLHDALRNSLGQK
ncbi:MAG: SGNH/GDSL hydrolase family protein [Alistipes sp.]|nr:SGNH/GDSL hydrolase family protein [Alistipes senegalensis]MCM1251147.1 SGNH/GDSL hydrolase family protein [Alistipes sp.]